MPPLPLITAQTEEKLLAFLTEHGHTKFRTQQVLDWVWRKRVTTFDAMSNLPPALKNLLAENFRFHTPEIVEIHGSADTTRKFLTRMEDGSLVESVIIPAAVAEDGEKADRTTLCVSSQVGCAFGCKFCASGLLGLKRHLTTGEIIGQILSAEAIAGKRVNNIVFMGMGEPMANYKAIMATIRTLTAPGPHGLGISARGITVSTVGLVPRIDELAQMGLPLTLFAFGAQMLPAAVALFMIFSLVHFTLGSEPAVARLLPQSSLRSGAQNDLWYYDTAQLITWLQSLPKPVAIMACDDNQAYHITEACLQIEGGGEIRASPTT